MKRGWLILALTLLALPLGGQNINSLNSNTTTVPAAGAPSGNCPGTLSYYLNTSNGDFYTCPTPGSSWVKVTGSGGTPSGAAGGDLSGTYPNPTVNAINLATSGHGGVTGILPAANVGTLLSGPGWPTLPNATVQQIYKSNIGTGDIVIFTVPANKRAIIVYNIFNGSGGSITSFQEVNLGGLGTIYRLSNNLVQTTLTGQTSAFSGFILEAGDVFELNTTGTGINLFGQAIVFDNTASIKTARAVVTTGDNTIYTCCSGSHTLAYSCCGGAGGYLGSNNGSLTAISNQSGGSLNYKWNLVASGGSPGATNQISPTTAGGNNTPINLLVAGALATGDFYSVNSSGTGQQLAWVTVVEQ